MAELGFELRASGYRVYVYNLHDGCIFFRATPTAYGGSQAKGLIGAVATGLHDSHSHSNVGSEPHL